MNLNNTIDANKQWAMISLFSLYVMTFMISPYFRGLFFHIDYYWVSILIHVCFLLTAAVFYKELIAFTREKGAMIALALAMPLIYGLSFFYSASPYEASNEALQWFSYAVLFIALLFWQSMLPKLREWLWLLGWITMSLLIALVYLAAFDQITMQHAVLEGRFSSVFQYPNTLASLVSAFVIAGLMLLTRPMRLPQQLLYSVPLLPMMLAFWLTDSRGGVAVLAIGWVLALFFLSWKRQLVYIGYSVLLAGLGLWGYSTYKDGMEEGILHTSVWLLIVLAAVFVVVVWLGQWLARRRLQPQAANTPTPSHESTNRDPNPKSNANRWSLLMPGVFIAVGGLIVLSLGTRLKDTLAHWLPEGVGNRITSISLESLQSDPRFLFYKDAMAMWKDHFWFGQGGGAWSALVETYKSLPYTSNQAHNFYMQTLVETGLIGGLLIFGFFVAVLAVSLRKWIVSRKQPVDQTMAAIFVLVVTLMIHHAVDFNMSFGTINLFMFSLLAMLASYAEAGKPAWLKTVSQRLSMDHKKWLTHGLVILVAVASVFGLYKSYAYDQSNQLVSELSQTQVDWDTAINRMNEAIDMQPNKPSIRYAMADVLKFGVKQLPEQREQLTGQIQEQYEAAIDLEPDSYVHHLEYGKYLVSVEETEMALQQLDQAVKLAPWQQTAYDWNVQTRVAELSELKKQNEQQEAKEKTDGLKNILNRYDEQMDKQQVASFKDELRITADNRPLFSQAYYFTGDYEKTLELTDVDLSSLEAEQQQLFLILRLLSFDLLGQTAERDELLKQPIVKDLEIDLQTLQALKENPAWRPIDAG